MSTTWFIRTNDLKWSEITDPVLECSKKTNTTLGLKKLGMYWLFAAVSIFIPMLHFILVPGFFLIGVYLFIIQLKNTHVIPAGFYSCPKCSEKKELKNFYFKDEQRLCCSNCGEQLSLIGQN